jgi:hypothetical protein
MEEDADQYNNSDHGKHDEILSEAAHQLFIHIGCQSHKQRTLATLKIAELTTIVLLIPAHSLHTCL